MSVSRANILTYSRRHLHLNSSSSSKKPRPIMMWSTLWCHRTIHMYPSLTSSSAMHNWMSSKNNLFNWIIFNLIRALSRALYKVYTHCDQFICVDILFFQLFVFILFFVLSKLKISSAVLIARLLTSIFCSSNRLCSIIFVFFIESTLLNCVLKRITFAIDSLFQKFKKK